MGLMRNVTKENYEKLAVMFAESNDDAAFMVCPVPFSDDGNHMPSSAPEFGAWRAYRAAKGLNVSLMDQFAQQAKPWTVPTKWPHEFDADSTFAQDETAGRYFAAHFRRTLTPRPADEAAVNRVVQSVDRLKSAAQPI